MTEPQVEELEPEGRIILIGTSNAGRVATKLNNTYNVEFIQVMTVDFGMERKVGNAVKELKPTAKDKIVFMVLGNSFLLSDDKDENLSLKGAFFRKHLVNPEGLQQEDLTSLVCKVGRTVTSLK